PPTTTGHRQPWAEARAVGDEPLGSVYDPFPLERNNVVTARDITQVLAVTSRHAFVRAPRVPAPRPRAGVAAAARVGDGLVIVISRRALGTLGPQVRPSAVPDCGLPAARRGRGGAWCAPGRRSTPSSRSSTPEDSTCWPATQARRARTPCIRAGTSARPCGALGRTPPNGSSPRASPGFPF